MIVAQRAPALTVRLCSVRPLPGVRAGSGLLRLGTQLLAVQDDAQALVWINAVNLACTPLVLEGSGEAQRKRDKPDYEALLQLPDGSVQVLGSGSRLNRHRIASLKFSSPGQAPQIELRNASPLYLTLADALGGTPNIEAALVVAGGLRLFHRGAGPEPDACLSLPLTALSDAEPQVLAITRFALGELNGVPLHFTDAALLPDGRVLYVAVAENTRDAIADGPVAGAALGILGADSAAWAALLEADGIPSLRKPEGIALNADGRSGWLITDPDDATRPAELCGFELAGDWQAGIMPALFA